MPELDFLGHHIDATGSRPLPKKVEALQQFLHPSTIQELQQFTGLVQFYNQFVSSINLLMSPLCKAVAGKKQLEAILWIPKLKQAFTTARSSLATATMLHHQSLQARTALTTDASNTGFGAVLEQFRNGWWIPLAFLSKSFRDAECKWSAFVRELLAIHLSLRFVPSRDTSSPSSRTKSPSPPYST